MKTYLSPLLLIAVLFFCFLSCKKKIAVEAPITYTQPPPVLPQLPSSFVPRDTQYVVDIIAAYEPGFYVSYDTAHGYYALMEKTLSAFAKSEIVFAGGTTPAGLDVYQTCHIYGGCYDPRVSLYEPRSLNQISFTTTTSIDLFERMQNGAFLFSDSCSVERGYGRFYAASPNSPKLFYSCQIDPINQTCVIKIKGVIHFN